jgi:5-methylcytosine-specific restriction endonuclease McrA
VSRAYAASHREQAKARAGAWYVANAAHVATRDAANRHRIREKERQRRANSPEVFRANAQRRRAALAGRRRTLTVAEWKATLEVFGHRCAYCLRADMSLEQDHVVALASGGHHEADNVVPACKSCNAKKGRRPVFMMARFIRAA